MSKKNSRPAKTRNGVTKQRILLVDDHPIVRQGLAALINQQEHLVVCGEADTAAKALELIPLLKPDMAVVDVSLRATSGIELIKDLQVQHPRLPVLVMSMHDETLYAERSLRAGARGYIMKQEANQRILEAIDRVLRGEIYVSEKVKEKMVYRLVEGNPAKSGFALDNLSDRELEVFQWIGQGFSTRQIAEKLHLSVKTIESYREQLKHKLQLKSGAELVQHAIQWSKSESAG
jgi:DNA-binding NarL/FixJ family response regulator